MVIRKRGEAPQTKPCLTNYTWAAHCKFLHIKISFTSRMVHAAVTTPIINHTKMDSIFVNLQLLVLALHHLLPMTVFGLFCGMDGYTFQKVEFRCYLFQYCCPLYVVWNY